MSTALLEADIDAIDGLRIMAAIIDGQMPRRGVHFCQLLFRCPECQHTTLEPAADQHGTPSGDCPGFWRVI